MSRNTLVAAEFMTIDGVIQAPSYPDEDPRGGFVGGWNAPYLSGDAQEWVLQALRDAGGFLYGRRTYDTFAAHWPSASEQEREWADPLNRTPKFVASRTLRDPAWGPVEVLADPFEQNPRVLDAIDGPLVLIGSGDLIRCLLTAGSVDRLRLVIDPVVLGAGARLFDIGGVAALRLELRDLRRAESGALLVEYASAR